MPNGSSTRRLAPLALVAVIGCGHPFPEPFASDRAVWSQLLTYEEVEVALPTFATHELELVLAIEPNDVGTGALESVLLAARRHGVPVRAWLLLDDSLGYRPNESNLEPFAEHVDELWSFSESHELGIEWIVVDMGPPLGDRDALVAAFTRGDLDAARVVLEANRDPTKFTSTRAAWADAVDDWHARGMHVEVVAFAHLLDDYGDDDLDLQDLFESPVDGIEWDEVGFHVPRELYGTAQARLGPELVRSYGLTAIERHGAGTSVVLGTIGASGYGEVEALAADVAAAATAGLERVQLFAIDGMLEHGGVHAWVADLELVPANVDESAEVQAARAAIATLDEP